MSRKRRREDGASPALAAQGVVDGKMYHHIKIITAAAKKAKTFELQRTIKRLKGVSNKDERAELEKELDAIKATEHRIIARDAFKSKLVKAKLAPRETTQTSTGVDGNGDERLSMFINSVLDAFHEATAAHSAAHTSSEFARAHARLFSNKVLAEAAAAGVDAVRHELYMKDGKGDPKSAKAAAPVREGKQRERTDKSEASAPSNASKKQTISSEEGPRNAEPWEESASEGVSEAVSDVHLDANGSPRSSSDDGDDDDESDDVDVDSDDDASRLPTLTTGFVSGRGLRLGRDADASDEDDWSDGDADLESVDENAELQGGKKPRKNRMGQRARRALSEKKYGKNANHLRFPKSDAGWGNRTANKEQQHRHKPSAGRNGPASVDANAAQDRGQDLRYAAKKNWDVSQRDPTQRVQEVASRHDLAPEAHPSWVAKQRQKEKEQEALRQREAAASKKIVFD